MKAITSRDNPLFKRIKALSGSNRRQHLEAQALLDGPHLARAYLDAVGQPELCLVTEAALARDEVRALVARIETGRVTVLTEALFGQLSNVVHGVGLLMAVAVPPASWPAELERTCVVLDAVQDAGNVGSILRSAAAAGVRHVFCTPGTALAWSPKVLRAAMGAHFLLEIHEDTTVQRLAPLLALPVVVTDSHGAVPVDLADLTGPVAWVFGNEGAGVAPDWMQLATHRVTIPQPGGLESLNVAAAAAICLFEQGRQQRCAARGAARTGSPATR